MSPGEGEEGMNHDWFWVRATYLGFVVQEKKVDPRTVTVCTVQYLCSGISRNDDYRNTLIICSDVRREDKVVPGLVAFTCPELLDCG